MVADENVVIDDDIVVPQTFDQLGILVLDGSGSMAGQTQGSITKAEAVNMAVRELLTRLIDSNNKRDFSIAVITFDDKAIVHTEVTRVYDDQGNPIDDNADYDPMKGHGDGTDIAKSLEKANEVAEEFLNNAPLEGVPHSVVIVVMSDGESQTDPVPVADKIKANPGITICSTLFAQKGKPNPQAQQVLQSTASSPTHYKTVYTGETLREFFIASVSSGKGVNIR